MQPGAGLLATVRRYCIVLTLAGGFGTAQQQSLTLDQCEQIAIRNHPRIAAASLSALASASAVDQVRAAYFPTAAANFTSAGADKGTVIAAGALPTSSLSSRAASGISVNQMILDFGRTAQLVETSRLRAAAQEQSTLATKADILLDVDRNFFATLAAQNVLTELTATVDARRVMLRQIRALAESSLKSTLDVSFAEVALAESELALSQADNQAKASHARLSASLGYADNASFDLVESNRLPLLESSIEEYVGRALKDRPDLAATQLHQSAAEHFANAEARLRYPTVSMMGVAGVLPVHPGSLSGTYAGAGLNISLPFLNGGLFAARRAEAEYRSQAAAKNVDDLKLQINAAVRVAWLDATNAYSRLAVAAQLVTYASTALRLARTRYDIGLGSIVELTQAQTAETSARITSVNARYEYLMRLSQLTYATGGFR